MRRITKSLYASFPTISASYLLAALFLFAGDSSIWAQTPRSRERGASEAKALATRYLEAHRSRYPESDPANVDGLFDNTIKGYAVWAQHESLFQKQLERITPKLDRQSPEAMTLALLKERLEMSQQFRACRRELWNVGPLTSWVTEYRAYVAQQPVGSEALRQAALRRWRKLPAFIDTEIATLRVGMRAGYTSPRVLVNAAIAQTDQLLALPTERSPFFAPASRDSSQEFRAAFQSLVRESITPALRRYRDYLANEYVAKARSSVGVGAMPNGSSCFRALIRRYTTLDVSPGELARRGRMLLASGDARAIRLRQQQLLADSANRFRTSREALDAVSDAQQRAASAAPKWFNRLPDVLVPSVDSMPDGGAEDPDAMYVPQNSTDPPRVYFNVPRLLEAGGHLYAERLAFHEGLPGHHLQVSLQRSADVHPLNRVLWNAAFGEGWAVYASNLAEEMGLYSSDVTRFASLKTKVDDGLTFVVQYGLHAQGWTRQQAIDTMLTYSGGGPDEMAQQVDYVIAAPAHALAYPLGARYIEDLRHSAARQLGPTFDVRRFHEVVLESGAPPLRVLRELVDRWVQRELAAHPQRPR